MPLDPPVDEPGWLRRLMEEAALAPHQAHDLAELLEIGAVLLRRPQEATDWPAVLAHAERLASAEPRQTALPGYLRRIRGLDAHPDRRRQAAAEIEAALAFLRRPEGGAARTLLVSEREEL